LTAAAYINTGLCDDYRLSNTAVLEVSAELLCPSGRCRLARMSKSRCVVRRLNAQQQALVSENIALSMWVIRRMWRSARVRWAFRHNVDELRSVAYEGLTKAAAYFEPERGIKFCTLATRLMIQAIWQAADRQRTQTRGLSFDPPARPEKVMDLVADTEASEQLEDALRHLPRRTRVIFEEHYAAGKDLAEIGQAMGVSRERIRQLVERGLETLRAHMPAPTR
jgi:RNA polymerase sigma factor (sigma-70 family)